MRRSRLVILLPSLIAAFAAYHLVLDYPFFRMKLTGRRTVPEIQFYYLAQCKNGRQYQIEIYVTGGEGEQIWEGQIDEFMKSFKPQDD